MAAIHVEAGRRSVAHLSRPDSGLLAIIVLGYRAGHDPARPECRDRSYRGPGASDAGGVSRLLPRRRGSEGVQHDRDPGSVTTGSLSDDARWDHAAPTASRSSGFAAHSTGAGHRNCRGSKARSPLTMASSWPRQTLLTVSLPHTRPSALSHTASRLATSSLIPRRTPSSGKSRYAGSMCT